MFNKKKSILLVMTMILSMVLVACGGSPSVDDPTPAVGEANEAAVEGYSLASENERFGALTVREVLASPEFLGQEVSVIGTTESVSRFSFAIADVDSTLPIDYRGSQALPDYGVEVKVTGIILVDCCDNATMVAMSYEVMDE